MKQPKRLTCEQKRCPSAHSLNWKDWALVEETEFYYRIINKRTGAIKSVDKFRGRMNAAQSVGMDAAQPLLRETMTIHIEGKPVVVYKDEIEKQLYGHLYSHLGLRYGG